MSPTHIPVERFNFAIDGAGVYSRPSTGGPSPLMYLLATRDGQCSVLQPSPRYSPHSPSGPLPWPPLALFHSGGSSRSTSAPRTFTIHMYNLVWTGVASASGSSALTHLRTFNVIAVTFFPLISSCFRTRSHARIVHSRRCTLLLATLWHWYLVVHACDSFSLPSYAVHATAQ